MKGRKNEGTIVWPVDPFQATDALLQKQIAMLQALTARWNATVIPVYVLSHAQVAVDPVLWDDWDVEFTAAARRKFAELLKEARIRRLASPEIVVERSPFKRAIVTALLKFARRNGADLIAVATHGRKGLQRLFMGSFAETLLLRSNVPLLTINPSHVVSPKFNELCLATDLRPRARQAFAKAAEFARRVGLELVIYHHYPTIAPPGDVVLPESYAAYEKRRMSELRARAESWALAATGDHCQVIIDQATGNHDARVALQCKAATGRILAMIPERHPLEARLLGSITRNVVRAATCPVWVLHRAPSAAR